MNESAVLLQSAYILQHRKYRETSLILDVFTQDFGIVSILAKGVRKKKSKLAGLLLVFTPLKLSYTGKSDLKILTHAELESSAIPFTGLSLYCGFYVNELVFSLLHKEDPCPEVFSEYANCLGLLRDTQKIEQVLRYFEIDLIEKIGYGINLGFDVENNCIIKPQKKYCFRGDLGILEYQEGYVDGSTLLALQAKEVLSQQALYEAKRLMRQVIDFQLQGKELKSRKVLARIIKTI